MKQIKNLEAITNILNIWKPSDLAFIVSFDWTSSNVSIIFLCQTRNKVFGWPDLSKDFFEIKIKFENVSNLTLNFSGRDIHQVTGFDIIDVSENGLSNINFEIEDYENGTIHFYCENIIIISNSKPASLEFYKKKHYH